MVEILWPGQLAQGPRTARASAPVLADYLPPLMRVFAWGFPLLGLLVLLTALGLSWSPWFDAGTIWRSPVPFLASAIPILAMLSVLGVRVALGPADRAAIRRAAATCARAARELGIHPHEALVLVRLALK